MTSRNRETQTVNSRSNATSQFDPYVTSASYAALQRAGQIADRSYTPYRGKRIAGLSSNERQAGTKASLGYEDARDMVTQSAGSSPYLEGALTLIDQGAGANQYGGEASNYIRSSTRSGTMDEASGLVRGSVASPYTDEAVNMVRSAGAGGNYDDARSTIKSGTRGFDEAWRAGAIDPYMEHLSRPMETEANREFEKARQESRAQQVFSGAFGGERGALEDATLSARHLENLRDIKGQAFDRALGVFADDQNRKISGGQALGALSAQEVNDRLASGQTMAQIAEADRQAKLNAGTALAQFGEAQAGREYTAGAALAELGEAEAGRKLAGGQSKAAIANAEQQRKLQSGQTLAGMNSQQVQDLMATGNVDRVLQQANLDFKYGEFLEARDWSITNLMPLLQTLSTIPKNVTQNETAYQIADTMTKSGGTAQILGAAAAIAGAFFTGGASLAVGAGMTAASAGAGGGKTSSSGWQNTMATTPGASSWNGALQNFGDQATQRLMLPSAYGAYK